MGLRRVGDRENEREAASRSPLLADADLVTIGLAVWIILRHALWFVGLMSLYAIWITHLADWATETLVEEEQRQS